ncbi:MmpS family transport accessory protein [Nocardia carnea]|uniref:MmpS family transport accessory protein n=1 Tax=Nocardia carnea TaxID=37328 RepID=UPI002456841C|nr:MmpS family transport accessory protein [Nocardia carnea]
MSYTDGNTFQRLQNVPAPWQTTVKNGDLPQVNLIAMTKGAEVTCRIKVDGAVRAENVARGTNAIVTCQGWLAGG